MLGDIPSPGAALRDHMYAALDNAPKYLSAIRALNFWTRTFDGLCGRTWAEFLYNQLAIPTSNMQSAELAQFEEALLAFQKAEAEVVQVSKQSIKLGARRLDAVALATFVTMTRNTMSDIVVLRRVGLEDLVSAKSNGSIAAFCDDSLSE